ncbi:hypothetical protein LEP1GSC172_3977 [Leptospira noguchii]|uniref:Uncharacterized protein n=2 Tax=Leptospira noguchii TaxID=28182 RepID=T0FJB2_9LEPT|nr:hypothetical protein LEP1GSC172_3977 [Leptospira noguchii]EQA73493.1 hypothetical protein LEP1GSC059_0291 [Leptospira noguchii serovar Panama str. CZ214]
MSSHIYFYGKIKKDIKFRTKEMIQNNVSSSALEIHNSFFCKKLGFELYKSISKCGNYCKSRFYKQILKL